MLLKNASYLDENFNIVEMDLLIRDRKVLINESWEGSTEEIIDCSNYIIIPGLFNSHYHGYSNVAKGLGKDMKIEDWCNESIQGEIQKKLFENIGNLSEMEYQIVCMKGYIDMVKNGVTFVSESSSGNNPRVVAEGLSKVGLRGIVDTYDQIEEYYLKQIGEVSFATHLLEEEDITDIAIQDCINKKDKYPSSFFLTHCMENDWRKDLIYSSYQKSSIKLYNEKKLLDDRTVLYHGVYLDEEDFDLLTNSGASIVHCPVSNFWTGAGIAPINNMLEKGINVCIGTDYGSVDIWESMKVAYLLLKNNVNINRFKAEDIFQMATLNGAKAYHQVSLGSIQHGFYADLVFIEKDEFIPSINTSHFSTILHNLLMDLKEERIHHVMINGEWIMRDRNLQMIDEAEINEKYKRIVDKLFII
ncbi:amidohydrolase family protein [Cytobacillus suaedae]|nr:amidohydrolase family protein [Cytobacillus suaedae]